MQTVERDGDVAPVDGVGQGPRRQRALVAGVGADVLTGELRARAERGDERLDEAPQPSEILTEMRRKHVACSGIELQSGLVEMLAEPRLRVAPRRGFDDLASSRLQAVGES